MNVRTTTNHRHRDEWEGASFYLDAEEVEFYIDNVIGLGWIPQAYDSSPIGRKVRFQDDEGFELYIVVKD